MCRNTLKLRRLAIRLQEVWCLYRNKNCVEYRVALQFPDHLLEDSVEVNIWLTGTTFILGYELYNMLQYLDRFEEIKHEIEPFAVVFFVLGDTSYGE